MSRAMGVAVLFAGCVPDISGDLDPGPKKVVVGPQTTAADGTVTKTIDATSLDTWNGYDLDLAEESPDDGDTWDLAFQRFTVRLNGGTGGSGSVEAAILEDVVFEDLVEAPVDGYLTDIPDEDGDDLDERVFDDWYIYDYVTHLLSPSDLVYVVRSTDGAYFKMTFEDYYDPESGTDAMVTFRWAPIAAPGEAR